MTGTVYLAVLLAALLHAGWNAAIRGASDRAAGLAAVVAGQGLLGLGLLPFVPVPSAGVWPWLLPGVALHLGYNVFLLWAYKLGDLTQVYPIARGVSPLLVALGTAAILGARFSALQLAGLCMISLGIASISLVRHRDGTFQGTAALVALGTGVFIAGYSIVDGQGARIGGSALGYFAWLTMLDGLLFALAARAVRPGLVTRAFSRPRHVVLGGGASFLAYVIVVWAFTQAPIALVTALRETSVIFALVIGVTVLGERLSLVKVAATFSTLAGAILLRLAKG